MEERVRDGIRIAATLATDALLSPLDQQLSFHVYSPGTRRRGWRISNGIGATIDENGEMGNASRVACISGKGVEDKGVEESEKWRFVGDENLRATVGKTVDRTRGVYRNGQGFGWARIGS